MLPDSGNLIPGCGELFPDLRYRNLIGKWLIITDILAWAGAEFEDFPGIFPSNREISSVLRSRSVRRLPGTACRFGRGVILRSRPVTKKSSITACRDRPEQPLGPRSANFAPGCRLESRRHLRRRRALVGP
jgi:hypothetical protein